MSLIEMMSQDTNYQMREQLKTKKGKNIQQPSSNCTNRSSNIHIQLETIQYIQRLKDQGIFSQNDKNGK